MSDSSDSEADVKEPTKNEDKLMAGEMCAEEVCSSNVLERIKDSLKSHSESVKESSRTAALWVQYMHMIDILCKFIRAKLGATLAGYPRHTFIHGSFRSQLLH